MECLALSKDISACWEGRVAALRQDLYVMEVYWSRNCYSYGGFGYITRNYRNQRIIKQGRKLKHRNNLNTRNNLNGK